ncbi:uncharacterized protein EI97DRAFT_470412 [Westerdykella ornata]|uniref:Uncharacterized protein n=1 Tax=Westerdykella ornata TaxID=318751 RepID=A0A6A6JB72_WESOR|nr:uncharacterized protein EI97DRAFT_470412 [Westerdykella ornata]KAF2272449.1 hypothetical protein EI97DRAFT_470412 [Westerdykella ornata]
MQRPPIACSKAVQSLNSPPQPHIWIPDELLLRTLHRFFRAGCTHQKRHGSHVPGPLEARRRAVKRKLSVQASLPQEGFGVPLFDLKALFGARSGGNPSWRYEAPSLSTASDPRGIPFDIRNVPPEPPFPSAVPAQNHDRKASAHMETMMDWGSHPSKEMSEERDAQDAVEVTVSLDLEIRAVEDRLRLSSNVESFLAHFDAWLRLADQLPPSERRKALVRCCGKGYAIEDQGPLLTLRILERLTRSHWSPRDIARWLSQPGVPLPSLGTHEGTRLLRHLRVQFDRLILPQSDGTSRAGGGHAIATLYKKIATPLLCKDVLDADTCRLLYWARWQKLLLDHRNSIEGSAFQSLQWLANFLSSTRTYRRQTRTFHQQVVNHLSRVVQSDSLNVASSGQIWDLVPTQALKLVDAQTKAAITGVNSVYAGHDIRVHHANVQFQAILDRARSANVLPPSYWNETIDAPSYRRAEIIHELAHRYSINHTRSSTHNWRAVKQLHRYLVSYDLPMKPLFTKALVRICLAEAMTRNKFVNGKTMAWVVEQVAKVEGADVARSIEYQFWVWRGGLIEKANRVARGLVGRNGGTKVRVNTLRRLGLLR